MAIAGLRRPIFQEPVKDLTFPGLGKTAIFKITPGPKVLAFITTLTVRISATGAASKSIPRPASGIGDMRFKLGNFNRSRKASELFGVNGLQGRNSVKSSGTVQYWNIVAGVSTLVTATLNGRTVGATPVPIDSAADVALQAALANNADTVGVFYLPWMFAEFWRKDPMWGGTALGLITAFGDTNGNIVSVLGTPYVELDIPAATGVAGTMTSVNISASLLYTEELAAAGSVVSMSKQKIHNVVYAVGDVELAKDFEVKDILQRFSVLCAADTISKIIVKYGARIIREVTFGESHCSDMISEIEGDAALAYRFDIDLDQDDDPTRALALDPTKKLSIVATFVTASDVPATARILADYWGPVEN